MTSFIFYAFLFLTLVSALFVILLKNPVHSVLLLIFTFLNAVGSMVMLGAEYIGMITIIVYVGAVIILFLFVVMMLDINFTKIKKETFKITPFVILGAATFLGIFYIALQRSETNLNPMLVTNSHTPDIFRDSVKHIGLSLYTDYVLEFQTAGIILLLAMIGVITLVYKKSSKIVRRQKIIQQIMRKKEDSIKLINVKSKSGVRI